ncbi:MAG: amidohydrolase [Phycisphaerales bacterium JB052]
MSVPPTSTLREAHAHIFQLGRSLTMIDLGDCESPQGMLDAIAARASAAAEDEWVLAHSARPEGWADPRWPTREQLDLASGNRPVVAWCFDYHAMLASTSALRHARIDAESRIESGVVELDDDGHPTGLLLEHAALHMWNRVPEPDDEQRVKLVRAACAHLSAIGYVEVHDLKAQPWLGTVLSELLRAGEISNMRFELYPLVPDLEASLDAQRQGFDEHVRIAGGKIFVDGTLNSRTAWMLHPYADGHPDRPNGTPMMTPAQIEEALCTCKDSGLPIAAHAIGDAAVRAVLDAIEKTGCDHSGCRIEHAELIDEADLRRFVEQGVKVSLQPCHLLPDIEALRRAVPDRLDRVLPIRSLLKSGLAPGVDLLFGSDVPIVGADPLDSVQAAVHRRRADMDESQAINMDDAIDEETAWACFWPEASL